MRVQTPPNLEAYRLLLQALRAAWLAPAWSGHLETGSLLSGRLCGTGREMGPWVDASLASPMTGISSCTWRVGEQAASLLWGAGRARHSGPWTSWTHRKTVSTNSREGSPCSLCLPLSPDPSRHRPFTTSHATAVASFPIPGTDLGTPVCLREQRRTAGIQWWGPSPLQGCKTCRD